MVSTVEQEELAAKILAAHGITPEAVEAKAKEYSGPSKRWLEQQEDEAVAHEAVKRLVANAGSKVLTQREVTNCFRASMKKSRLAREKKIKAAARRAEKKEYDSHKARAARAEAAREKKRIIAEKLDLKAAKAKERAIHELTVREAGLNSRIAECRMKIGGRRLRGKEASMRQWERAEKVAWEELEVVRIDLAALRESDD